MWLVQGHTQELDIKFKLSDYTILLSFFSRIWRQLMSVPVPEVYPPSREFLISYFARRFSSLLSWEHGIGLRLMHEDELRALR